MFDLTKMYVFYGGENAGSMVGQNKWKDLHVDILKSDVDNWYGRQETLELVSYRRIKVRIIG